MESKPGQYGIERALTLATFHPGYWKTLANLRKDCARMVVEGPALAFTDYTFAPASVFPSGTVTPDQIAEVNLGYRCQLRLTSGEILFVPHADKEALIGFIHHVDLTTQSRSSVWGALLDPFLDTWEDQQTIDRQFAWFAKLGLDRKAVDAWRAEVAVAMVAYNFGTGLWEWTSLDLYDVLKAQQARLSRAAFADFYARAMRLTQLDSVHAGWNPSGGNTLGSTLFSVLLEWCPREKEGSAKRVKEMEQRLAAELTAAYSEPHRRYHTVRHVEDCLTELGAAWPYAIRLNEVRWALLFHDAIYDPRRQDNESRSADWACRVMDELGRPEDEKARVRGMIAATAHSNEPRTPDEALLLDIDLSILGAEEAKFDDYDRSIRTEYGWVPEQIYRRARAEILESFLNRERLYHTAPYRRRCEIPARANLRRALERLRE